MRVCGQKNPGLNVTISPSLNATLNPALNSSIAWTLSWRRRTSTTSSCRSDSRPWQIFVTHRWVWRPPTASAA